LGYTYLYLFTAAAYSIAIFLAVLSVWLAKRGRLYGLCGVLALALSMGIYQAYVTVAISLSLLVVFRETLDPKADFQGTLRLGLRLVVNLAAGAAVYYLILLCFLRVKGLELLSYLGMDAASSGYPIGQLPHLLLSTYKQVVSFFFRPGSADGFASGWMVAGDVLSVAVGAFFFVRWMQKKKLWTPLWRPLGALAMLALLPLGMNFSQILSPYSTPTPLMKYAFVAAYLAVILLTDLADGISVVSWSRWAAALCAGVLLVTFLNTNNLLYTASAQAHRATESYITRLLARIESCPGYEQGMEVAIVGAIPTDQIYAQIDSYQLIRHYSVPLDTVAPLNKHIYYYLNDWLNVPLEEPDEETMLEISNSPAFQAMPLYPSEGSVQVLDGRVVVRIQEQYTPKADYELAYENRR
jgi:hypothetical protein